MFEIIVTTAFTRTHFIHFLKTAQTVDTSFMLSAAVCYSYLVESIGIKREHPFRNSALACMHAHACNENDADYHRLEHRTHFVH